MARPTLCFASLLLAPAILHASIAAGARAAPIGGGGAAKPSLTITVDFNSTAKITESDGAVVDAKATTGLADADKTAILALVQAKYQAIPGIGAVSVVSGDAVAAAQAGGYSVVISDTDSPGQWFGDKGRPGAPAIVYYGRFKAKTDGLGGKVFTGAGLVNAVGETAAHEAAHVIGGLGHNALNPAANPAQAPMSLMANGSAVSYPQRAADNRAFTEAESKAILVNLGLPAGSSKGPGAGAGGAGAAKPLAVVFGHNVVAAGTDIEDPNLSAQMWLTGSVGGFSGGYIGTGGSFVFATTNTAKAAPGSKDGDYIDLSLQDDPYANWDFAVRDAGGDVYDYETYGAGVTLSSPDPLNPGVDDTAVLDFNIGGQTLALNLDTGIAGDDSTGGFSVPEPSGLAAAFALLTLARLRAAGRKDGPTPLKIARPPG